MSDIIWNTPHLINKIIFYFKGLMTPSAIAMNEAFKKKELLRDFKDLDMGIYEFYKDDVGDEYLLLDSKITFMYIAITPIIYDDEYLIPPLRWGTFFRHNLFSYREEHFCVEDYNRLFEDLDIVS